MRHKNVNWNIPTENNGAPKTWDDVRTALLMDLRDEAQEQNRLAKAIYRVLDRMDRRMAKHMPLTRRGSK